LKLPAIHERHLGHWKSLMYSKGIYETARLGRETLTCLGIWRVSAMVHCAILHGIRSYPLDGDQSDSYVLSNDNATQERIFKGKGSLEV
jgi:hypothetical protein